jgi:hypothetical protein
MARRRQSEVTDTSAAGHLPAVSISGELEPRAPPATSTSQALVPANTVSASPLDLPTQVFQAGLDRRKQNRAALMDWIRAALVEGTDYGRVHIVGRDRCSYAKRGEAKQCPELRHWSKPSLLKPGSEKICGMLGVIVHYPALEHYEQAALEGVQLSHVIIRCELKDGQGTVVAVGVGARSVAQDGGDLNKCLKMAEKSAHIDATLRMAGLSEVFTQDLEDIGDSDESGERGDTSSSTKGAQTPEKGQSAQAPGNGKGAPSTRPDNGASRPPAASNPTSKAKGSPKPSTPPPASSRDPSPASSSGRISATDVQDLESLIRDLKLDPAWVKQRLAEATGGRVKEFSQLSPTLYRKLVDKLEDWAERAAIEGDGHAGG